VSEILTVFEHNGWEAQVKTEIPLIKDVLQDINHTYGQLKRSYAKPHCKYS